jgi:starvation-inducible DNA-binding protein
MFEAQYNELALAVDLSPSASRLGFPARHVLGVREAFVDPETEGVPEAGEMIRLLVQGRRRSSRTRAPIFPVVDKAADEPTRTC